MSVRPLHGSPFPDLRRVVFCGYCARRGQVGDPWRVCGACEMGLLLRAHPDVAPAEEEPFLVVDELLRIRAVSRRAEPLLGTEAVLVDRHVGEVLLSAEAAAASSSLSPVVSRVVREGLEPARDRLVPVRPRDTYGVRFGARVGRCEPGLGALVVLAERL